MKYKAKDPSWERSKSWEEVGKKGPTLPVGEPQLVGLVLTG